jgi:hypothetical protein
MITEMHCIYWIKCILINEDTQKIIHSNTDCYYRNKNVDIKFSVQDVFLE